MTKFISKFVQDESGAPAIEYGLIAALIAVVVFFVMQSLGNNLKTTFNQVSNNLSSSNA